MDESILAKRLKGLREQRGYYQKFVAEKLGIRSNTLSGYENGTRMPDPEMLSKLADLYNVSTDYLLGRTLYTLHRDFILPVEEAIELLNTKLQRNKISKDEETLLEELRNSQQKDEDIDLEIVQKAKNFLAKEKDVAKRLETFREELEHSDGLAFDGEPMSEEAKDSLIESMELLFRQTQRINKKFTPKKYRED